jgi:hypothetical protein
MVETDFNISRDYRLTTYINNMRNSNVRTQAQIDRDNLRLNRNNSTNQTTATNNNLNFNPPDYVLPRNLDMNSISRAPQTTNEAARQQRLQTETDAQNAFRESIYNGMGIGLNINILV